MKLIKKGDKLIHLPTGRIYIVKYVIGNKPIVSDGKFDFPAYPQVFAPYSSLMEALS